MMEASDAVSRSPASMLGRARPVMTAHSAVSRPAAITAAAKWVTQRSQERTAGSDPTEIAVRPTMTNARGVRGVFSSTGSMLTSATKAMNDNTGHDRDIAAYA